MNSPAVRIRVPATSANLGPGFDALGLALALYDEIDAQIVEGPTRVEVTGAGAGELPTDAKHLVVRAAHAAFAEMGQQPPPLHLQCRNRIPQQRGLGSSAAAIVGGITVARALRPGRLDDAAALALAGRMEGHADNVASCLLGGLVLTWREGSDRAVRLEPADGLQVAALVPQERSETEQMRGLLPEAVPHRDAAFAAGRAALLIHALTSAPELLFPATEDRLHQKYRAGATPGTARLVQTLREVGIPAVVSGAGPSVLVLGTGETLSESPIESIARSGDRSGWNMLPVGIDRAGATVVVQPGRTTFGTAARE